MITHVVLYFPCVATTLPHEAGKQMYMILSKLLKLLPNQITIEIIKDFCICYCTHTFTSEKLSITLYSGVTHSEIVHITLIKHTLTAVSALLANFCTKGVV